jgi:hypothetical protein
VETAAAGHRWRQTEEEGAAIVVDATPVGGDSEPGALVVVRSRSSGAGERDGGYVRDGIGSEVRLLAGARCVLDAGNVTMLTRPGLAGEHR